MDSPLKGEANILICPNLDAANILFNVLKVVSARARRSARYSWVLRRQRMC